MFSEACVYIFTYVAGRLFTASFGACPPVLQAFEMLVVSKMFVATAMPSTTMASAFVRYRCVVQRGDVKRATEEMGQTNLKKWLSKAQ
jgi:hypothetical protein